MYKTRMKLMLLASLCVIVKLAPEDSTKESKGESKNNTGKEQIDEETNENSPEEDQSTEQEQNKEDADLVIRSDYKVNLNMIRKGDNIEYKIESSISKENGKKKLSMKKFKKNIKRKLKIDRSNSKKSFLQSTFFKAPEEEKAAINTIIPLFKDSLVVEYDGEELSVKCDGICKKHTIVEDTAKEIIKKILEGSEPIQKDKDKNKENKQQKSKTDANNNIDESAVKTDVDKEDTEKTNVEA